MKLSKSKKILLLGTTLALLTTSIVTPIVLLNKDENNKENDVEKIFKILQAKTTKEKIIELSNSASGKIIANNQEKIVAKIKTLIGKANLKNVKIEVSMEKDINISTIPQKIIIKLTKNQISKEIEDFSVKKINPIDEEIESIKKSLDAKTNNDLIIILPSSSTGNIIGNATNKNAIERKLRILIDSLNINGEANHPSLKGTTIEISMDVDAPISITPQNIIVSISKSGGKTLSTTEIFQVKRNFTPDEDIVAIKTILDAKTNNDLIIILPSSSTGNIIGNATNKNAIERKLRMLIDPSNTNGNPNHASLRGTSIQVSMDVDAPISATPQNIIVEVSKTNGTTLRITETFQVRIFTANEDIKAIKKIFESKTGNDLIITLPGNSTGIVLENQNEIRKKLRILIDPSNINGDPHHQSLRGTIIYISIEQDEIISTTPQDIVVYIWKSGGKILLIRDKFQVKKESTSK